MSLGLMYLAFVALPLALVAFALWGSPMFRKTDCLRMGHWWGAEWPWTLPMIEGQGWDVEYRYAVRSCQRCSEQDRRFIAREVIGLA